MSENNSKNEKLFEKHNDKRIFLDTDIIIDFMCGEKWGKLTKLHLAHKDNGWVHATVLREASERKPRLAKYKSKVNWPRVYGYTGGEFPEWQNETPDNFDSIRFNRRVEIAERRMDPGEARSVIAASFDNDFFVTADRDAIDTIKKFKFLKEKFLLDMYDLFVQTVVCKKWKLGKAKTIFEYICKNSDFTPKSDVRSIGECLESAGFRPGDYT